MHTTTLPTPVGPFSLAVATDGVYAAGFASDPGSLELPAKPFTCSAWNAMRQVPPGSTVTYTGLAGNPGAARAA
jgi:O6-methylguanine-DNA--protein-cysteine methyltransferase